MGDGKLQKSKKPFESAARLFQKSNVQGAPPPEFIKALAGSLKCSWGTYWKVNPATNKLRSVTIWSSLSTDTKKLDEKTKSKNLALNEGTAGQVWRTRKPFWTTNLIQDMCIPRSLGAEESGLDSGLWFAIKTGEIVYGVVELLGKGLPERNAETLLLIEQMGIELGQIIQLTSKNRNPNR